MGRDYGARYLRQQQSLYSGKARRPFDIDEAFTTPSPSAGGPPEGFKEVILEWLDQHLPPIVKKSTGFNRYTTSNYVSLATNPDYVIVDSPWRTSHIGTLYFREETVEIICHETGLNVSVEYAHPQLFEVIQMGLSKFFNGTK